MALSEVDHLLIEKHTRGTLTPREFAMWSGRMQDQEFVSEWHRIQNEAMAAIGEAIGSSSDETDEQMKHVEPERMSGSEKWVTIFNAALMILLFIILLAFIAFLMLPEAWVEESSFGRW